MSKRRYEEFVQRGDLTTVVYAHATSKPGEYALTAQVLRQPKGQGTTIVADHLVLGSLVKDTALSTSQEWVSRATMPGSMKTRVHLDPTLRSALYTVGDLVNRHFERQEA